jgi:phage-related protein
MLTLSSAAIMEKNSLSSDGVWAVLAKIILPDGVTTLRLCRNTEDVGWPVVATSVAAVANKGGGLVGIPRNSHGYVSGDTISITGTDNYDGKYTVDASTTANEIVITATYVAETLTASSRVAYNWIAFPFDLDDISDKSKNEVPRIVLKVGNASRAIMYYMEIAGGGEGSTVEINVIHTKHLDLTTPEYRVTMQCMQSSADDKWAYFTLGMPSPFSVRFPRNRILKDFCRWRFKGTECGYSGAATECNKGLAACRALSNSARFGGFPGVGFGGVYVK